MCVYLNTMVLLLMFSSCMASFTTQQRLAFKTCMENQRRLAQREKFVEESLARCKAYARHSKPGNILQETDTRRHMEEQVMKQTAKDLALKYFITLGMWKNGETDLGSGVLDDISPCWRRSEILENKWTSLYEMRKDNDVTMLKVLDQRWVDDEGIATIAPIAGKLHMGDLVAGEIILHRASPSSIGENFGRYRTAVYMTRGNKSEERIHADFQSSCPTRRGNIMILDLDLQELNQWRNTGDQVIKFRIRVQPRRQYFDSNRRNEGKMRVPVVKQVVGLVLHSIPPTENVSPHLLSAFLQNPPDPLVPQNIGTRNAFSDEPSIGTDEVPVDHDRKGDDEIMNALLGLEMSQTRNGQQKNNLVRGAARGKRSVDKTDRTRQRRLAMNTRPPPTISPRTPRKCRRMSHRLSPNTYRNLGIVHPDYNHDMFEIGECAGDCPVPLVSTNLNVTYHSVAISAGMGRNPDLTICCVPVTYGHVFITAYEKGDLFQKVLKNLKANSCACR